MDEYGGAQKKKAASAVLFRTRRLLLSIAYTIG